MEFSRWLQNQLDARDWQQRDLADESGLSTTIISRYIIGTDIPSRASTIEKIANALRITEEEVRGATRGETITVEHPDIWLRAVPDATPEEIRRALPVAEATVRAYIEQLRRQQREDQE